MFENMTKEEAKKKIFDCVREYYNEFHKESDYNEGDKIGYSGRVYDSSEMINLVDSALNFWLTTGKYTFEFERKFCEMFNVKYCR